VEILEAKGGDVDYVEPTGPWGHRLPKGEMVIVQGMPDVGKSTVARDLLARATTGRRMPGAKGVQKKRLACRNVLWITSEESEQSIRKRFECAGGDNSRLTIIRDFSGKTDFDKLADYCRKKKVRYIVVDPIENIFNAADELASTFKVRKVLQPFFTLIQDIGATMLMMRHLNQKTDLSAMFRGVGSVGIDAFARIAFLLGRNPEEPDEETSFVVTTYKYNIGTKPASFTYRTVGAEGNERIGVIEWGQENEDIKKDHVLAFDIGSPKSAVNEGRSSKVDEGIRLLVEELSSGERPTKEIEQLATERGMSKRTLEAARKTLRVSSRRIGGRDGHFVLSLPGSTPTEPNSATTVNEATPSTPRPHRRGVRKIPRPPADVEVVDKTKGVIYLRVSKQSKPMSWFVNMTAQQVFNLVKMGEITDAQMGRINQARAKAGFPEASPVQKVSPARKVAKPALSKGGVPKKAVRGAQRAREVTTQEDHLETTTTSTVPLTKPRKLKRSKPV